MVEFLIREALMERLDGEEARAARSVVEEARVSPAEEQAVSHAALMAQARGGG